MAIRSHNYASSSSSSWLLISSLLLACCCWQHLTTTNASAINDVNNMLRDSSSSSNNNNNGLSATSTTATGASAGSHIVDLYTAETGAQYRKDNEDINDNRGDNNNNDYDDNFTEDGDNDNVDDETSIESSEMLRFVDDVAPQNVAVTVTSNSINSDNTATVADMLPLNDQVRLLTKQLNALMLRRREDYEMLERNLRKSLRITTNAATVDLDMRQELDQLRHELKTMRDTHLAGNKEKLTIDWLTQSLAEIRKQLAELQQIASNAAKDSGRRAQGFEDLATIRSDFSQLKLELAAMRERQERVEVFVQELREETLQQEADYKRLLHQQHRTKQQNEQQDESQDNGQFNNEITADHKRRHCRFQRQQIHDLQLAQRDLKRQLTELKYHRIGERVRSIEIEQHRIADANFNLSRQIASLDKLHSSMLELLEDVEGLQNKLDKNVPELRHEISKLEFTSAQLNSEQSLVREEGKNVARSVQAMAVSVSALQEEREGVREMQTSVQLLQQQAARMQGVLDEVQRTVKHKLEAVDELSHVKHHHEHQHGRNNGNSTAAALTTAESLSSTSSAAAAAANLVAKLENVEQQYESILNKLPRDCSEVAETSTNNGVGLYLIAPAAQHRPLMAQCHHNGWTTVQRRYDGSADFNRTWEEYAAGFGAPQGEYWIGNEQLHALTQHNCSALRIEMIDIYDNVWLAEYERFAVSSRADGYRLHVGGYSGNASDALDYQQAMQFSAIDVDRDISQTHCAANYEGGWWFSHCQHANLNGRYNLGLTWFDAARNEWIAVKSSQMLVRRLPAAACRYDAVTVSATATASLSATLSAATTVSATTTAAE